MASRTIITRLHDIGRAKAVHSKSRWAPPTIGIARINRSFSSTTRAHADFTHVVRKAVGERAVFANHSAQIVGGGAVGLAIASRLACRPGASTLLIERHGTVGTETSSRNSEVIHAGLYYGKDSIKTRLCIEGKRMLYTLCDKHNIGHRKVGKWIVAQDEDGLAALLRIHDFSKSVDHAPTRFVSRAEAAHEEPYVRALAGILESPTTGILDSHAYMQHLLGVFEEHGGDLALNSTVSAIVPHGHGMGESGWDITVRDGGSGEDTIIKTETIINAAGLGARTINNMILPPERHRPGYFAKGNYFAYTASRPKTRRLIYPAPEPGLAGLGTHLTLDLAGRIRFGPDVEWISDAEDVAVNASRLPLALAQIKKYLPGVDENAVVPDYAGIRPKLLSEQDVLAGSGSMDFIIRKEPGFQGFVNLLGIESPGLTCSLAIGKMVERLFYE